MVVIVRCRVQYGKYFPSFSYFEVTAKYEKGGGTRQREISTLSLNVCLNKMYQE